MADVKDQVNLRVNLSYGDSYINDDASSSDAVREGMYLQFIFWGIMVPFIASFGFVGNTLTMFVLFRREMRSTTIFYLRALVITDSSILLVAVAVLTPFSIAEISTDFRYYKDVVYPLIFTYLNYATMAVQTCNVWITVSVSVERYIAICHPFVAPRITTNKMTLIVIGAVTVFSIAYNIPRLFATASRECADKGDCYELYTTEFGQGDGYKVAYQGWMYVIVMFVIPLTALFVLNILIIMELMRMAKRRRGTNIQSDDEANLSLVLVLIVVVFIICQTPGLIAQFDIFSFPVFLKLLAVSNTMFVLNSSVNFLIYTFVGRRFRKVLIKRVFYWCVKAESLSSNFITNHSHAYELTRVNDSV